MGLLTMTDLFCGAGGSSTGAVQVPGVSVRLAANHWQVAIATHNANHPDTDHLQADISNIDPRYVASTDLLWASPECTNHSRAKGRSTRPDQFGEVLPDEAAERSRATMWDVVRFAEVHHYRVILVENVVEIADWSSPTGRKGGLFEAWLSAMHAMGYLHRVISLNSMHAQTFGLPAPQSRDRVYIAFWREGERAPDFERILRPRAWCPSCDEVVRAVQTWKRAGQVTGRYRQQYMYSCPKKSCAGQVVEPGWLPAASIIDWSIPGQRIGDRARPLADKTMRRIQLGIERYWSPIHLEAAGNTFEREGYIRAWPTDEPLKTVHTTMSKGLAYAPVTTRSETGMATPPFLTQFRDRIRDLDPRVEPLRTLVADGASYGLVTTYYGNGAATPADRALPTVTTHDRHALVVPAGGTWNDQARPASDPMVSLTTREAYGLIMRNNSGGPEMTTPDYEPIRTLTTGGHQSLMTGGSLDINDVRFRMLEPAEIKRAMAFEADYIMVGTRREQVRQSGNAVTPCSARDLIAVSAEAITGEQLLTAA